MKQQLSLIIVLVLLPIMMFAAAPVVSNVTVSQRTDGSMLVDITYDVADDDGDDLEISVECSNDGGTTWDYAITQLSGDVGPAIAPGTDKAIVWDFPAEHPDEYDTDYIVRISAEDGEVVTPEMVTVPAGTFQMGDTQNHGWASSQPVHTVNLDSFNIGVYEVTHQEVINVFNWAYQQGYIACSSSSVTNVTGDQQNLMDMNNQYNAIDWNGSKLVFGSTDINPYPDCPCVFISWYGTVAFCNYLSLHEGLTPCYDLSDWSCDFTANGYRLPTEAEWEYSARGASDTPDYLYAGSNTLSEVGWYSTNRTHPVGMKQANDIGTYDQSGNAYELCWDIYASYTAEEQTNPTGPTTGWAHVKRGGPWSASPFACEVAYRHYSGSAVSGADIGFRLCRNANPIPAGMVYVPSGSFQMGRTGMATPIHTVNLDAFYIGTYEVTHQEVIDLFNWAYQQGYVNCSSSTVTNASGNQQELLDLNDSDCAIDWNGSELVFEGNSYASDIQCTCIEITWYGSVAYCNYLSLQEGLTPCYDLSDWSCDWSANGYRLPTEAEWEYSARGATNTPDYLYAGSDTIGDVAWYNGNNSPYGTKPGGQKDENDIGTYDQSGNVWEWCWDRYGLYTSGAQTNPHGRNSGSYRVIRGGSWAHDASYSEVAYRYYYAPSTSYSYVGFRPCRRVE